MSSARSIGCASRNGFRFAFVWKIRRWSFCGLVQARWSRSNMAAPVASGSAYISDLVSLLAPQHGRLSYAARLALICTLTVLVVEIYQTPEPALATYIVFFLNRDSRTQSLILNVVLTLLITIIIAVVIMVARLVLDDGMWRVISMALISFG